MLFRSFEFAQGKSKQARYFEAYRRDPEKNQRINARRKWQRALKKDLEMNGNVRPLFGPHENGGVSKNHRINSSGSESSCLEANSRSHTSSQIHTDICEKSDFLSEVLFELTCLDPKAFARNFPPAVIMGILAFYACQFVVAQTLPLYESLNFPNAKMAAAGAIALAVGFAGLSALTRSRLAKLFVAVMICYEALLVFVGTKVNQRDLTFEAVRSNPTYVQAQESYGLTRSDYELKKRRFEDQNSGVYQNQWFKSKHLDPSFVKFTAATEKLSLVKNNLHNNKLDDSLQLWLKILYRLSAVVLCMMLAKGAAGKASRVFRYF